MGEPVVLRERLQNLASLALGSLGLLVCAARVALARFRPVVAAASCSPAAQPVVQEWGSRASFGPYLGGLM
jgi:hypothetical protein